MSTEKDSGHMPSKFHYHIYKKIIIKDLNCLIGLMVITPLKVKGDILLEKLRLAATFPHIGLQPIGGYTTESVCHIQRWARPARCK